MGDHEEDVGIFAKIRLEPHARLEVEVIGWLICEEDHSRPKRTHHRLIPRSRIVGRMKRDLARAMRMRHPPENSFVFFACIVCDCQKGPFCPQVK